MRSLTAIGVWSSFERSIDYAVSDQIKLEMTVCTHGITTVSYSGVSVHALIDKIRQLPGMSIGKSFEEVLAMQYWEPLWNSVIEPSQSSGLALICFNMNAAHGHRVFKLEEQGLNLPRFEDALIAAMSWARSGINSPVAFPHNSRVFFTIGGITPRPRYMHIWPTWDGYELDLNYIDDCWNTNKRTSAVPKEVLYAVLK